MQQTPLNTTRMFIMQFFQISCEFTDYLVLRFKLTSNFVCKFKVCKQTERQNMKQVYVEEFEGILEVIYRRIFGYLGKPLRKRGLAKQMFSGCSTKREEQLEISCCCVVVVFGKFSIEFIQPKDDFVSLWKLCCLGVFSVLYIV